MTDDLMRSVHYRPWMCSACGYMMDAASAVVGDAIPKEDDISLCLNCGALYRLHGERWLPLTPAEMAELSVDYRRYLTGLQIRRKVVITKDLAKKGGRA